jgi:hypothetical protein
VYRIWLLFSVVGSKSVSGPKSQGSATLVKYYLSIFGTVYREKFKSKIIKKDFFKSNEKNNNKLELEIWTKAYL